MQVKPYQEKVVSKSVNDKIPLYDTISDFLAAIGVPQHIETDFTIDTLENYFKGKLIKSQAFKSNYFVFVFITSGSGCIMVDNEKFKVGPNAFYYINPGHLRSINIAKSLKGYMMSTNEHFLKRYYKGDLYRDFPFLEYSMIPPITIEGSLVICFNDFLSSILKTYRCEKGPYKYQIINNLAITFQYKIKELFLTSNAEPYKKYNSSALVKHFMKLLDETFRGLVDGRIEKRATVKEYGNMLKVSPNYLSMRVKKETGRSVSQWIYTRAIADSQALLLNTDLPIARISEKLGFDEASNFIKYFKKKVGRTPKEYREQGIFIHNP
jgi:AraC family transcriptional activator of pobA